jgi:Skp family chaperone for outer membrane proteins
MLAIGTACSASLPAVAAPPLALVDVKFIYNELPSTTLLQKEISARKDALLLDRRAEELRKVISEMQAIESQLQDKTAGLTEDAKRELARSYESKRQIAKTMQQEFERFRAEQVKIINKEMVTAMRAALNRISDTAANLGRDRGFQAVLDRSGETNTGVPFVLYAKNPIDLTADVLSIVMASEPPTPPATTSETPAPNTPEP